MSVRKIEIKDKSLFADGKVFVGNDDGIMYVFKHGKDLKLAPTNSDGRVAFTSKFSLITPSDANLGNNRLVVDIVNRGRPLIHSNFNRVDLFNNDEGDGFLFNTGFILQILRLI